MKTDRKIKAEKSPPKLKTVKGNGQGALRTDEKHPLAYQHIPVGIVEASLDGKYMDVNEEFCRILGYSRRELLRRSIKDFTHEDDYELDLRLYEQLITEKIPFYRLEKRFLRKDGGIIWVELTRTLVCDAKGKPHYTMGVVLDISDRKDVERVLRDSVERLRLATGAAQMFMWEWDFQTQSYTIADNFEKVLGFSAGLLPRNKFETLWALSPKEDIERISEAFERAVEHQTDLHALSCRVSNPENGQIVWLEISAKIVYDRAGKPERMFGVAQNITESKNIQEEIAIISRMPEENPNPVMRLRPEGKVLYANPTGANLLEDWIQGVQPVIPEELGKTITQAFTSGRKTEVEVGHHGKHFSFMVAPILEAGYVNLYGQDITERKEAEIALQRSESNLWNFLENASVGIHWVDKNGIIIWTNQAELEMLGYTREEYIGRHIAEFHVDKAVIEDILHRLARGETLNNYEARLLHKDGSIRYGIINSNVLWENGEFIHTRCFTRDITERKQAEEKLRASEERFRALVSQATAGIAESDLESRLVFVNPGLCEMLGYSEAELLGKTIWELTYAEDLEENKRLFKQMLEQGKSYQFEKRFIRKDGSTLWTSVSVTSIHDSAGKPKGGVGVVLDIQNRKQAEAALAEYARQQESLYQLSDRLHHTESLTDVFDAALDAILKALQCNRASILLFDDSKVMRFVAWRGLSDAYRKATEGHSPWVPDAQDPQPVVMNDVRTAELSEALRGVIQAEGIESLAFIPLVSNEKLIGKFMVYFDSPHAFEEGELDLSLTIARQLAAGIDRKRAEEKLRESEERYRVVVESQSEMLCRFQSDGKILFANSAYARARGTTPDELINHNFWEFIAEADRPAVKVVLDRLTPDMPEVHIENRFETADGERWTLWTNRALRFDSNGHFLEAQSSGIDITERKQAEQALRHNIAFDEAVMNSMGEGLCTVDNQGLVVFMNPAAEKLFGWTLEELRGRKMHGVTHYQHRDGTPFPEEECAGLHVLRTGKPLIGYQDVFIRKDGTFFDVTYSSSPLRGEDGSITGLVVVFEDTTEHKRYEQALRKSEERYRFIVENTSDGIWWIELTEPMPITLPEDEQIDWYYEHAVIRQCNLGMARMYGYNSIEEVVGMPMRVLMPRENSVNLELSRQFVRSGYRLVDAESREKGQDGRELVFLNNMVGIIEDGKLKGEWGTNRDITARKRAEEALRASESLYRTIARSIPGGGVYVVDKDFRYLIAEGPVTEAFGLTREMLEGHTVGEVFPGERGERMETRLRKNFAGESVSYETNHNGRVYWTQQAPLLDSIGQAIILTLDITERKQAEEALRQSEERFAHFMQHLPGLAWIKDIKGRYVYANAAAEKAFHTPREKLYGKTDEEIFPPEAAAQFRQNDQQALTEAEGIQVIETLKHADGVLHYSLVSKFPIPGPDGSTTLIGGTAFDVTERLQAEEALRESEERFRAILRQATAGIVRKDPEGRLIFVNEAFCNMLGRTETNLLGKTIWEFMHPDDVAENKKSYDRLMLEGIPFNLERRFLREDGSVIWIDASVSPIMDAYGKPQSAVAVEVDITARKQAEELLYESERRFREMINALPTAIYTTDAEGRITHFNPAAVEFSGRVPELGTDRWCVTWKLYHPDGTPMPHDQCPMAIALKEGRVVRGSEAIAERPDGTRIWFEPYPTPLYDSEGRIVGGINMLVDITERKQAEEALRQLNLQLEDRVLSRTAKLRAVNQTLRDEIAERKRVEDALRISEAAARENEEKLSTLFDLLPVGISFLDPEGQIIQMNPALTNILKLSKEGLSEPAYHRSRKYIRANGTVMPPTEFASRRALTEGKTIYNLETGIILENSEVVWMSVSAAPVNVADVGAVVVTVDITESKRAEQALQESRERLQILSQRLVEVQEDERRAIARELHDRVGQTLAALNINLIIISGQLGGKVDEQISTRLNDSMKLVAETIALVRDVMSNLRPAVLDDYGLVAAIESQLTQFASRYQIQTKFEKPNQPIPRLSPTIEMTFLRIAQEALMNTAKHAQATQVTLTLQRDENIVCMTVQDNGVGIASLQEANRPGSHGLTIMRERAEAFGGNLEVSSVPGKGTKVEVNIPIEANDPSQTEKEKSL